VLKIFTFTSNRPDFIDLQMNSFRRHLKEDFEFVVFNNSKLSGDSCYDEINKRCREVGATSIDIQRDLALVEECQKLETACSIFNPHGVYSIANVAHAYALNWAWQNVISKETGPVAIFDSDIFLVQPIKLTDVLYPHQLCCVYDGKPRPQGPPIMYMWPTFVLIDMARFPDPQTLNWFCGRIENVPVDVGGQTFHYFQAHPELDIFNVPRTHFCDSESGNFDILNPSNYDEFAVGDSVVLHYRSGSNWNRRSPEYHQKKTAWLKQRIGE